MKKVLTLAAALMVFGATTSMAAGLFANWTDCYGALPLANKTFACNTNAGGDAFICSIVIPADLTMFTATSAIVDVTVDDVALPAYWQVGAGQCSANRISVTFDPAVLLNFSTCPDIWGGSAQVLSVFQTQPGLHGANTLRLNSGAAIPSGTEIPIAANGAEWTICRFNIGHAKTVGTGNCLGCAAGACIVFNEAKVQQPLGVGDFTVTNAGAPGSNFITWQSGHGLCPAVTPTQNRTWGSVKNLYR